MKKSAKKTTPREVETAPPQMTLKELVRAELREFVVSAGMGALDELLEQERAEVCGPRYAHLPGRRAH